MMRPDDFCRPQPPRTVMGHLTNNTTQCRANGTPAFQLVPFGMFDENNFCLSYDVPQMIFAGRNHRAPSWVIHQQSTNAAQRTLLHLGCRFVCIDETTLPFHDAPR
jgi:hypothetical protein